MYARNYGASPRTPKIVFEQTPQSDQDDIENSPSRSEQVTKNTAEASAKRPKTDTPALECDERDENESVNEQDECHASTKFGARGIPPQPLKRRRIPSKKTSSECDDSAVKAEANTPKVSTPQSADQSQAPKAVNRRERDGDAARSVTPCRHEPAFSSEELLLAGLILLLVNDRANDDILLMLGFLLVSCFRGD